MRRVNPDIFKPVDSPAHFILRAWQEKFVESYLQELKQRSLLVAAVGTGKTVAALNLAQQMRRNDLADSMLVITDRRVLQEQWLSSARHQSIDLVSSSAAVSQKAQSGVVTIQTLHDQQRNSLLESAAGKRWFIIVDEAHRATKDIISLVDGLLAGNHESRALFVGQIAPQESSFKAQFRFDTEFFFDKSVIHLPENKIHIARFSPSYGLLDRLRKKERNIDELNWRDLETVVAELLEEDGYVVQQMRGTKDGGVDVIAVKDLGAAGKFKTLWQAKKKGVKNKVGLSLIRELADTRIEHAASKAIIVTSSYLTKGALDRVKRDNYILGKVDRDDLELWIAQKFSA